MRLYDKVKIPVVTSVGAATGYSGVMLGAKIGELTGGAEIPIDITAPVGALALGGAFCYKAVQEAFEKSDSVPLNKI